MNPHIERMNYYNDPRTLAGMVKKDKIEETPQGNFLVFEEYLDDGSSVEHRLRCKWEVCGLCNGDGRHVNQSIDCCGLTAEDFADDPDFADDYFRGSYDVTCNECNGKRVVPKIDRDHNDKALLAAYDKLVKERWDDARESAAERAMGA